VDGGERWESNKTGIGGSTREDGSDEESGASTSGSSCNPSLHPQRFVAKSRHAIVTLARIISGSMVKSASQFQVH